MSPPGRPKGEYRSAQHEGIRVSAAALQDSMLLPQSPGGLRQGAALALLAHAGLIAALTLGLNWRTHSPDIVAAELWAPLPEFAAPRVEPAPAPVAPPAAPTPKVEAPRPDPQIAVEMEKRKRLAEREDKLEREAQAARKKLEQEQRDSRAAEARLAQQREENLRRMLGQIGAGNPSSTGAAAQDAGPSKSYAGKLVAQIKPNIVFTDTIPGNLAAEVEVRAAPSGTIVARRLVKSSGRKDWDDAVLRAIDRTATLPRDVDGRVPPTIIVAFRPQE